MIPRKIRRFFELQALDVCSQLGVPVFFENEAIPDVFSPPYVLCIVRSTFYYAGNVAGTRSMIDGTLHFNIYAPRGDGMGETSRVYEALSSHFAFGRRFPNSIRITRAMDTRATYFDESGLAITPTITQFCVEKA